MVTSALLVVSGLARGAEPKAAVAREVAALTCGYAATELQRGEPLVAMVRSYGLLPAWFDLESFEAELIACLPERSMRAEPGTPLIDVDDLGQSAALLQGLGFGGVLSVELHPAGERLDVGIAHRRPEVATLTSPEMHFFEEPEPEPEPEPVAEASTETPLPDRRTEKQAAERERASKPRWGHTLARRPTTWLSTGRLPGAWDAGSTGDAYVGASYLSYDRVNHGQLQGRYQGERGLGVGTDLSIGASTDRPGGRQDSTSRNWSTYGWWSLRWGAVRLVPFVALRAWRWPDNNNATAELGPGLGTALAVNRTLTVEASGYPSLVKTDFHSSLAPQAWTALRLLSPRYEAAIRFQPERSWVRASLIEEQLTLSAGRVSRGGWAVSAEAAVGYTFPGDAGVALHLGRQPRRKR